MVLIGMASLPFSSAIAATAAPVAFVYVASNYSGYNNQVKGYAVAANGQLTAIAGSPFYANVSSMAVNGKYLLATGNAAVSNNGKNVYSYLINANGSLSYKGATDVRNGDSTYFASYITLDHTGASAYVYGSDGTNSGFESYSVDKSTGLLHYLNSTLGTNNLTVNGPPYTVLANNQWVNGVFTNGYYINFATYQREANGALANINAQVAFPAGMTMGGTLNLARADASNHLSIIANCTGTDQVATYAVDPETGDLSTGSSCTTMPNSAVGDSQSTAMAYSGKILAVGGTKGLQLFNFSGTAQATQRTGPLLAGVNISGVTWDSSNHLYAISRASNKLYVFTVTSSGVTAAPGSPYTITGPQSMIVQPK
jgi:6-phosphogluconolactonase (cycloisomerase 2 family)